MVRLKSVAVRLLTLFTMTAIRIDCYVLGLDDGLGLDFGLEILHRQPSVIFDRFYYPITLLIVTVNQIEYLEAITGLVLIYSHMLYDAFHFVIVVLMCFVVLHLYE